MNEAESPEQLIVLYSKYSPQCKKILNVYDAQAMSWIKLVCVDNERLRQRILSAKELDIKTVPCVILLYADMRMEKFEGHGVIDWILSQMTANAATTRTDLDGGDDISPQEETTGEGAMTGTREGLPAPPPSSVETGASAPRVTGIEDLVDDFDGSSLGAGAGSEAIVQQSVSHQKSIKELAAEMQADRGADIPPAVATKYC